MLASRWVRKKTENAAALFASLSVVVIRPSSSLRSVWRVKRGKDKNAGSIFFFFFISRPVHAIDVRGGQSPGRRVLWRPLDASIDSPDWRMCVCEVKITTKSQQPRILPELGQMRPRRF